MSGRRQPVSNRTLYVPEVGSSSFLSSSNTTTSTSAAAGKKKDKTGKKRRQNNRRATNSNKSTNGSFKIIAGSKKHYPLTTKQNALELLKSKAAEEELRISAHDAPHPGLKKQKTLWQPKSNQTQRHRSQTSSLSSSSTFTSKNSIKRKFSRHVLPFVSRRWRLVGKTQQHSLLPNFNSATTISDSLPSSKSSIYNVSTSSSAPSSISAPMSASTFDQVYGEEKKIVIPNNDRFTVIGVVGRQGVGKTYVIRSITV